MQSLESAGTPEPGAGRGSLPWGPLLFHLQENGLPRAGEETVLATRKLTGI